MTCVCLVIRPDGVAVAPELLVAFQALGIKPIYSPGWHLVPGLLRQMRFDVMLLDDRGCHASVVARLAALSEFDTSVLVLRSAFSERQELELLGAGAAEVIDCAASPQLIAMKITKVATRNAVEPRTNHRATLRVGLLRLHPDRLLASVGDVPLSLTQSQFDLLFALALSAGEFVHRSTLHKGMRIDCSESRRGVDMQISRIRQRLRAAGASSLSIHSVYRYGYCLTVRGESSSTSQAI